MAEISLNYQQNNTQSSFLSNQQLGQSKFQNNKDYVYDVNEQCNAEKRTSISPQQQSQQQQYAIKSDELKKMYDIFCEQLEDKYEFKDLEEQNIEYEGYLGQIFLAKDEKNNECAIKKINLQDQNGKFSNDLFQKAKAISQLSHPNIIKHYENLKISNNYYIVMEMCTHNLKKNNFKINQNQIYEFYIINFATELLSAINYINQQEGNKFTLKERKIENILIGNKNEVKICNFDLVDNILLENYDIPQQHQHCYPPEWQEQQKNKEYLLSFKADSWTFGMSLYYLVGGQQQDLIWQNEYIQLDQLSKELNQILSKILCKDYNQRLSISDIKNQFDELKQKKLEQNLKDVIFEEFQKIKNQQKETAYKLITMCTQIDKNNELYLYEQGFLQDDLKFYDEAIQSFDKLVKLNKNNKTKNDNYYYNLAIAYKNKGQLEDAIKQYQEAISIQPLNPSYYYNLGIAQVENGLFLQGIKSYTICLQKDSKKIACHYNIGFAYSEKGQYDKAIKSYDKYLKELENVQTYDALIQYHECLYNQGNCFYEKRQYDKAIEKYDLAIKKFYESQNRQQQMNQNYESQNNYNHSKYFYNLGQAYFLKKKLEEAIKNFEESINIDKKFNKNNKAKIHFYESLAVACRQQKQWRKVKENYQICQSLDNTDQDYFLEVAIAKDEIGKAESDDSSIEDAIKDYKEYIKNNPSSKRGQRRLAAAEKYLLKKKNRCNMF